MTHQPTMRAKLLSEFIGTFTLIAVGVAAVLNLGNVADNGGLVGIALAHGLAIAVMVSAIGHVSGGHLNPAVTTAMIALRKIAVVEGLFYIVAQLAGGVVGALLIKSTWPDSAAFDKAGAASVQLGSSISPGTGMLLEAVATFLLVWVVYATAVDGDGTFSKIAGLGIGLTVAIDILMIGPATGATMNPARWFGPNLVTGTWGDAWVWIVGPIVGAIVAGVAYVYGVRPRQVEES